MSTILQIFFRAYQNVNIRPHLSFTTLATDEEKQLHYPFKFSYVISSKTPTISNFLLTSVLHQRMRYTKMLRKEQSQISMQQDCHVPSKPTSLHCKPKCSSRNKDHQSKFHL
mmetsp:Transcript_8169/g.16960  ORF Transcript_8169/g.16960 Transcript_8169/m.16960 type:complete len:112 (-) Transcript_8169:37-372(-)